MISVTKIAIMAVVFGLVGGLIGAVMVIDLTNGKDNTIKDWYEGEVAVKVSPHHIRKGMDKGDGSFILVDLRSQKEYEQEHIVGAVNVPAYKDPDHSAYGDVERIVNAVREIKENNPDKDVIVYCYSIPCMTGRKVGNILAQNGVYVKELGVGWNEWRHYWNLWNHEHEWNQTDVMDYVVSGGEPGTPVRKTNSTVCSIEGAFGC